ncbi:MAG: hypothetical protein R2568_11480 [Candidatus Scalindua sp.]|jgi:hypothetical protein|nr:hypothetical protein [Candidatus Scalindua sp.]MDV5167347.1 hypothetical protein [Candidatus Scalindua sp.]
MKSTDQYYTEKVSSILNSNDEEAKKQLEETIELLHLYLQSKNIHRQDITDKVISIKNVVRFKGHLGPRSLPVGLEDYRG